MAGSAGFLVAEVAAVAVSALLTLVPAILADSDR
jgi:hypothetical protein